MKRIISIKTLARKSLPKYEIRKEHVIYSDGTTEDRVVCYTNTGIFLGGVKEADKNLASLLSKQEKRDFRRKSLNN